MSLAWRLGVGNAATTVWLGGWVLAGRRLGGVWTAATLRLEGGRCRIVIRSLGDLIGGSLTFFSFFPPLMERFISFLI
jgi:hypothetical protein